MNFQYLLFDADNTLWDFNEAERIALKASIEAFGIAYQNTHLFTYHHINHQCWSDFEKGLLTQEVLRYRRFELFLEKLEHHADPHAFGTHYLEGLASSNHMISGARKLLDELKGKYQLVMVTNGLKEVQRPRIANTQVEHYFEEIVISDEIGVAKPHQGFFDHTFESIGHPPKDQVLVIGDSLSSDMKGGNNYGLSTCWFNPKGKENNSEVQPDYEIRDLKELWGII